MTTEATPHHAPATWLTAAELADRLGVSDKTITQRWCRTEGMPHFRVGSIIRFDLDQVDRWMRSRVVGDHDDRRLRSVS